MEKEWKGEKGKEDREVEEAERKEGTAAAAGKWRAVSRESEMHKTAYLCAEKSRVRGYSQAMFYWRVKS